MYCFLYRDAASNDIYDVLCERRRQEEGKRSEMMIMIQGYR
jgi:hypothetical protein